MNEEIWRPVVGYEGFYEVSNFGRVRSLYSGKNLKYVTNRCGYFRLTLVKNKVKTPILVHRIVAQAFIPNPDNKPFIDHLNGNRQDNSVENLRWVYPVENSNNPITLYNLKKATQKRIGKKCIAIKDGVIFEFPSIRQCAKSLNLDYASTYYVYVGKYKSVNGWSIMSA